MARAVSRVLVLAAVPVDEAGLRNAAPDLWEGEPPTVKVVAPAADLSFAEWLATDEDAAREEAAQTARRTAGEVPAGEVEAEVGDPDLVQAARDALAGFPADEVIVVVPPDEEASWRERTGTEGLAGLGLPVRTVVVHADRPA